MLRAVYFVVALYTLYAILYVVALAGELDKYEVLVGCLTTHFLGLAGHAILIAAGRTRIAGLQVDDTLYPPAFWPVYLIVDSAQLAVLALAVTTLAGGIEEDEQLAAGGLVIAYLGVVGCFGKLLL